MIRPLLLKPKRSLKKASPSSENRPPLSLRGAIHGKQVSLQQSSGLANSQVEIISSRIAQVPGTNDGQKNYGGFDDPNPAHRSNYIPVKFTPRQNPFYCALPYNDKAHTGHRPEAPRVVPWFKEAYQGPAVSTCKDRWVAIRKGNRIAYAQWEDAGPFRTDHCQYVFGDERPKPNLNKGAGLDISPAVRDFLGLKQTDVTDWRFVDFSEVPRGPWSTLGENNTFVINGRRKSVKLAEELRRNREGVIDR